MDSPEIDRVPDLLQALREAEESLRQAQTTNALLEQSIATLGHELRNPLQAVYSASAWVERQATTPAIKEAVGRIRTNTKRLSSLIDDVTDFARGKLGAGIQVHLDETDAVSEALAAVVFGFQDAQPGRQILADIQVPAKLRCDLQRVQQIASNLIANALTHGSALTPVKVTATLDRKDLVLAVWNSGDPIPPESIDKIFEPFWRHSSARNRQGLGLGLHICSQIVRAHGGSLSVTSTSEEGTRFTVRLPCAAGA